MPFRIRYLPAVALGDIPALDPPMRERIKAAIEERLATDPAKYGKPLRRSLSGLRKLRVGDYRLIFRIEGGEVLVVAIGHRKRIYTPRPKPPG
jgi:mRNA interferase RelE/StbE